MSLHLYIDCNGDGCEASAEIRTGEGLRATAGPKGWTRRRGVQREGGRMRRLREDFCPKCSRKRGRRQ